MLDEQDDLDPILRTHFERTLTRHLGRVENAFRSRARSLPQYRPARRVLWITAGFVSAAAAVVAFALLRPALPHRPAPSIPPAAFSAGDDKSNLRCTTFWRTLDDGVVYAADNTPLRKLRKQQIQQVSWTDDGGKSRVQITIPVEQVLFAEYETF